MSVIVALSGGKSSAWCANWALNNYQKDQVILYFNDTKWEHEDLYRFLNDLEKYFDHKITYDSDGRSPEQLFRDNRALANNKMPFCSRILKAERLQKFYKDGDTIVFGISSDERQRADRIIRVYQLVAAKSGKWPKLRFPLIENDVTSKDIDEWLKAIKIEEPLLYKLGFVHNNCSGGCVRAGKIYWKLLYDTLPEVYLERERVEKEIMKFLGKKVTIFKNESLEHFRERIETGKLSKYYYRKNKKLKPIECIGVCNTFN